MDNTESRTHRNYWKAEEENLLKQWADKAQCYQWMHSRSHNIYSRKNAMFTIPVIIISTITGTANFAQERFSEDIKNYVVIGIGTLSIIAGIITTIYQFLKIAEVNEGHRVSSLSWGKFFRNIKTELTRHPLDRMSPLELIKISRDEYDRLVELSPIMPINVIKEFNSKFNKNIDLTKPEICDELTSTNIFQLDDNAREKLIREINHLNKPPEDPKLKKKRQTIKKQIDEKNERFRKTFYSLNGRYPTEIEIKKNMTKFVDEENALLNDTTIEMNDIINDDVVLDMNSSQSLTENITSNIQDIGTSLEVESSSMNTENNSDIQVLEQDV